MARRLTDAELAVDGRELTFEDIPIELRPSGWRVWLDRVTAEQLASRAADDDRYFDAERARAIVACGLHSAAYDAWLTEHDLVTKTGQPIRGWDSVTVCRWEESER